MHFSDWLLFNEDNNDLVRLLRSLMDRYPQLEDLFAYEDDYKVKLDSIKVKPNFRGQGIGSAVLEELKQFAASVSKPLVLVPEPEKRKKEALDRFYRRAGFVHNKGRNKDYKLSSTFAPTMYWKPPIND